MVKNILKNDFIKLKPDETVNSALKKMKEMKKSMAAVVNSNNILVGILVKSDLFRFLEQQGHFEMYPIELAMTKNVITATTNESIVNVAKLMRENDVSAIPILENGRVVGLVTLEDIVDKYIIENS